MGQVTGSRNTTGSEKEIGMTTENANPSPPGEISPAALNHNAPIMCGKGLNAENSPGFSSRGRIFLLTFPFIELEGEVELEYI
jgi:hypothetical protein